jgi:hypothetical protein
LPPRSYRLNLAGNFERFRQLAAQLPPPRKSQRDILAGANSFAPQPQANPQFESFQSERFRVARPQGWETYSTRDSGTWALAPPGGLLRNPYGNVMIGYGALASYYRSQSPDPAMATGELLTALQQSDPALRITGDSRSLNLHGETGLITPLTGKSPYGGQESDLLLTVMRPQGLFYMVFMAPMDRSSQAQAIFNQMVNSLQFLS